MLMISEGWKLTWTAPRRFRPPLGRKMAAYDTVTENKQTNKHALHLVRAMKKDVPRRDLMYVFPPNEDPATISGRTVFIMIVFTFCLFCVFHISRFPVSQLSRFPDSQITWNRKTFLRCVLSMFVHVRQYPLACLSHEAPLLPRTSDMILALRFLYPIWVRSCW